MFVVHIAKTKEQSAEERIETAKCFTKLNLMEKLITSTCSHCPRENQRVTCSLKMYLYADNRIGIGDNKDREGITYVDNTVCVSLAIL